MTDLYAELGVPRTPPPTTAQIRAAYRRRAKRVHPDVGGSIEEFQRVTTAMQVLTSTERRRAYDETDRVEDAPVDNTEQMALQFVFGQVDFVLAQVEARGLFLDEVDVIGDARIGLTQKLGEIDAAVRKLQKNRETAEKVAAKFRAKRGKVDRIGPMYHSRAADVARNIEAHARDRGIIERAVEILGEHEFAGGGRTRQRASNPLAQEAQGRFMNDVFRNAFYQGGT